MVSAEAATDGTLSGALASVTGSVRELQSHLANELSGQEIRGFDAPDTLTQAYADAQATQQALVDGGLPERKRKERGDAEAVKLWAKPPGTSLIDPDVAPFLAYNEEYFRDITAADVARLVPAGPAEPTDDPDYRVPALGRYYALEWEDEDAREAARAKAEAARRAAEEEEAARLKPACVTSAWLPRCNIITTRWTPWTRSLERKPAYPKSRSTLVSTALRASSKLAGQICRS